MFENILKFFKKANKDKTVPTDSKSAAKERLHLVLMQDRANVSADFLDLMKQEIIEVIKKYIEVDENAIDVRLTNKENDDGTNGAPALYANIPILNIKNEARKVDAHSKDLKDDKTKNNNVARKNENDENKETIETKKELNDSKTEKNDNEEINKTNEDKEKTQEETHKKVESTTDNK